MKVYYGTNFWGCPKEAEELEKIPLNKEFSWDSLSGFIPAVYVGEQGIAVDICVRVSNVEVKAFYEKWKPKLHDQISEEEERQVRSENPLNIDFSLKISVNGEKFENDFGCGTCYSSVIAKEYTTAHPGKEEELMTEYSCDQNFAWYFKRHMCKWEVRPKELKTLEIEFISSNKEFFCAPIEFGMESVGSSYELKHPLGGKIYKLYVHDMEQGEIDQELFKRLNKKEEKVQHPMHYVALIYSLSPELSAARFQLQNADYGDKPRKIQENSDGTVTVIGYIDGATSVFLAGKQKDEEKRTAVSSLYFEPVKGAKWRPVFLEKEREDMTLYIAF